jgi:hypothetical protein
MAGAASEARVGIKNCAAVGTLIRHGKPIGNRKASPSLTTLAEVGSSLMTVILQSEYS